METRANANHSVSIASVWIYVANYKIFIPLVKEALDIIRVSSENDNIIAYFDKVYYEVMYANPR